MAGRAWPYRGKGEGEGEVGGARPGLGTIVGGIKTSRWADHGNAGGGRFWGAEPGCGVPRFDKEGPIGVLLGVAGPAGGRFWACCCCCCSGCCCCWIGARPLGEPLPGLLDLRVVCQHILPNLSYFCTRLTQKEHYPHANFRAAVAAVVAAAAVL